MASPQAPNLARISSPLGTDKLLLRSFGGTEELARLFDYEAEVFSEQRKLDFNLLLGQPVAIELKLPKGTRWFHAIVIRCVQVESALRYATYRLSLAPWFWLLTRAKNCRIFQDMSVPDIAKKIFTEHGFGGDCESRLSANYSPRDFCVQYRESDFDFISRLFEEEGVYYFFEHHNNQHVLVLTDSPSIHKPFPGYEQVPYRSPSDAEQRLDAIYQWTNVAEVQTGKVALNDYNFEEHNKSIKGGLRTSSAVRKTYAHSDLEVFDYPGDYAHESLGATYARIRVEELNSRQTAISCEGTARGLAPGFVFKLVEHPRQDKNDKFLVVRAQIHCVSGEYAGPDGDADKAGFSASIVATPADRQFRPARDTPRPFVHGPQTAVVVGPAGQEIYVDDHARVKVQFHWDRYGKRDQNSSCWVRISQPWAGTGFGGMNIPRIGQEVVVDFLEGDPDRPIITGRVYNSDSMPHASNAGRDGKPGNSKPTGMTQAAMMTSFKSNSLGGSGGSNEITMNDAGGAEGLFIKAQKDEMHKVGNDRERFVANNEAVDIGNDQSLHVKNNRTKAVDNNESETIGVNKSIKVGSNHEEKIGSNMSLNVGSNKTETVAIASAETIGAVKALSIGAGYQVSVGASMNTTVALTQTEQVGLIKHTLVGSKYTIEVGSASITLESGGKVTIKGSEFLFEASGPVKINGSVVDIN